VCHILVGCPCKGNIVHCQHLQNNENISSVFKAFVNSISGRVDTRPTPLTAYFMLSSMMWGPAGQQQKDTIAHEDDLYLEFLKEKADFSHEFAKTKSLLKKMKNYTSSEELAFVEPERGKRSNSRRNAIPEFSNQEETPLVQGIDYEDVEYDRDYEDD